MDIQQWLDIRKVLYNDVLEFLDGKEENDIITIFEKYITKNNDGFEELLHLILKISKYHHRNSNFRAKITEIILFLSKELKERYSNFEIFNFFKHDKQILLILFENGIITSDSSIVNIVSNENPKYSSYYEFFYPEMKSPIEKEKIEKIQNDACLMRRDE